MDVLTLADAEEVAAAAADRLAAAVGSRPEVVLGLPTGRTAVPLYAELARRHGDGAIDLTRARGFNLDELLLPPHHPASFHAYMERHAWGVTGLDRTRCEIPDAGADPQQECRRYERALQEAGGFDLALLGLGRDGHVAYNLPGPPVEATHVVELPEELADRLEIPTEQRPLRAITVGLGALRSARRLVMMATGAAKRAAVRALLDGPEDPRWPCTLLRDHPALEVLLDREASPLL